MEEQIHSRDRYNLQYLERQIHNLTRLVDINTIINSTLDMAKLLTLIMEIIKDIMETEASTLLLYEEDSKDLVFKVALGEAGRELEEKYRVRLGQGIAGWVAEHRETVYINDVYGDDRFDPNFDKKTGFTTKSILCAPLLFKGKLQGVIQAINPLRKPEFDDEDVTLFNAFSTQCVLAVQNAIFFQNALEEQRIKNELSAARAIQKSLLPPVNREHGGVVISARSFAAREVGGEFYDIFYHDDGSVGIALGDLQARGIPGAIYASITSGAVRALSALKIKSPSVLLKRAYETVRDLLSEDRALSRVYGNVSGNDLQLQFANAGIAYPILVRERVARYLRLGGDFEGRDLKNIQVKLQRGDSFVIITDGIINLKNRGGKLLGLKRVMKHIEGDFSTPDDIIDSLVALMNEFTEGLERREDVSIIAFRVR